MMGYYYHPKHEFIATILDEDIVDLKNRDNNINFVRCYVAIHDITTDRVFIQEQDDFSEEFISFDEEDIPLLREWYDIDDVTYHKLKTEFLKAIRGVK
ncbi:TPA: hypothetical protein HLT91_23980 [Escherichia coli]|nr:hypothetical protein [Escherichia coli]